MTLLLLLVFAAVTNGADYFGKYIGRMRNASYAMDGEVFIVNTTHLQILEFTLKRTLDRSEIALLLLNDKEETRVESLYEYKEDGRRTWIKPYSGELRDGLNKGRRLVIAAPRELRHWDHFAIVNMRRKEIISSIRLGNEFPEPYCCIHGENNQIGIKGEYGLRVGPIEVLDSKTIRLPNFSFLGSKPPDGWVYVGSGQILQNAGKKGLILGRDSPHKHCAMHEDYYNADLTVQLGRGQDIYDAEWISIFCYEYEHDFGHVKVKLSPKTTPVPAYLPPVSENPPPKRAKDTCP